MSTAEKPTTIPDEVLAEMELRAARAAKGVRDMEDARKACERMDQMREELRRSVGQTDIAVELIREARNPE